MRIDMHVTETLCQTITQTTFDSLPSQVVEVAKRLSRGRLRPDPTQWLSRYAAQLHPQRIGQRRPEQRRVEVDFRATPYPNDDARNSRMKQRELQRRRR